MSNPSERLLAAFPANMALPEPLIAFFKWAETQDLYQNWDGGGYAHLLIDPIYKAQPNCIWIEEPHPNNAKSWTRNEDISVYNRLTIFCRTGGDGSYAGLWQDDDEQLHFVHLGSGSGSIALGIMTSDALDFLRLLAIGYEELCWVEDHHLTPAEIFDRDAEEEDTLSAPKSLRAWLLETYGVTPPNCAADILGELREMGDPDDRFSSWLEKVSEIKR